MINTLTTVDEEVLAEIHAEMKLRKTSEVFLLFPLGSQFDHLIKLALDRLGVYCLVADPASLKVADVVLLQPKGIILSGGPASVHTDEVPFDTRIFDLEIPTLGICLGYQLWAHHFGFEVIPADKREFGVHTLEIQPHWGIDGELLNGLMDKTPVLQSHSDYVKPGDGLVILGRTDNSPAAAVRYHYLWGVQFHPEVSATRSGQHILSNFCFRICQARDRFPSSEVAAVKVEQLRQIIRDKTVLLALSGGSDSAGVAYLLQRAVPGQIHAVYIKGIDRPDDEAYVRLYFDNRDWLKLEVVDATDVFLEALAGHTTMKAKRVAMRGVYKQVLEEAAERVGASFIAQGTLYTDISESGGGLGSGARKAQIKLHHNTGLGFALPELTPLDDLVKDGARLVGSAAGAPDELMYRHPFPGPGLVVRIEGEVTAERLEIARQADGIYIEELRAAGLYDSVWQAGAVVTQSETTCTKGDDASTGLLLMLWAVWSVNGFTADWAELPPEFLRQVSRRLTNEIREVGAVGYRISDKPPATIEWG